MVLRAIRALAEPRLRPFRRTILSALGMAAIVIGLLAMHSAGAEHADASEVSSAMTHAFHRHGNGAVVAPLPATTMATLSPASLVLCDEACAHGAMDPVLMAMGCAMLLAVVGFLLFAPRPGLFQRLSDAGGRVVAALPRTPLHTLRPDLDALSISRT